MDGWVKLGMALDTKQLEKDIKKSESELKQFQREEERLLTKKEKIDVDLSAYEEQKQKIKESNAEMLKQATTEEQKNFVLGLQNAEIDKLNSKYSKTLDANKEINTKISENKDNQSRLNEEIGEMNQKLQQAKGFQNVTNSIKTASSETSNIIRKIGKWALAVFSIRSAYSFVRNSISTVSQYNQQVATDIEYIRYALAMTLQPVIIGIINLVKTLLSYINYIAKAWFGVNLFANAGAKAFQRAKEGTGGIKNNIDDATKSAKKLNKELAGFDEMNVLGGNVDESSGGASSGGSGADVGGITAPSFDLSAPEDIQPPTWLKWIVDNKDLILSVIAGITAGLLAWKLGLSGLQSLGIGLAVAGIVYAIQNLIKYLNDPSLQNFGKILIGVGVAIAGIGALLASWPVALAGAIVAVVGIIIANWEKIKSTLQEGIDWLLNSGNPLFEFIGRLAQIGVDAFEQMIMGIKEMFDGLIDLLTGVFTGNWEQAWEGIKEIFHGFIEFCLGSFNSTWSFVEGILDLVKDKFKWLWDAIVAIITPIVEFFKSIFGTVWENIQIVVYDIGQIFKALWEGIKFVFQPVANFFKSVFSEAWRAITDTFSPLVNFFKGLFNEVGGFLSSFGAKVGDIIGGAFKGVVNYVLSAIETVLNSPINTINSLISVINAIPGIKLRRLSTFRLPRLAKGGIINQPGRGVPLGSAIGGEAGREGVIPLTDQQAMAQLGMEIGKNVVINLTNVTKLDNRQIAKEQKRINQQNDFAYNR